jgi:hypothetical protein
MDPQKTNSWLTLGANIGVLIGIILLVVELDQNREMIRAQTRNEISQQLVERLSLLSSSTALSSVKRRAERGEELSEDEEHQYYLMFVANMRAWENIHYQYRQGLFDEREFNAEKLAWQLVSNRNEAFSRNWCILHATLSPDFVAELEGLLDDDPCPVVTD